MSGIGESRVITNRRQTPEEGIRLSLYSDVRQAGADPSGFLDALAFAVREEVWAKLKDEADRPLSFHRFIEAPYPVGIGSTVKVVAKLAQLPHRHEDGSPEIEAAMMAMRRKVAELIGQESPGTTKNGGDRRSGAFSLTCQTEPPSGQGGNSRPYRIARLKAYDEVHRTDFAARVIGKKLSAAAAMRESGLDPAPTGLDALRRAWGKATEDERAAFLSDIGVS